MDLRKEKISKMGILLLKTACFGGIITYPIISKSILWTEFSVLNCKIGAEFGGRRAAQGVRELRTFRIAGLTVQVTSQEMLDVGEKWSKFLAPTEPAQLCYDVRYAEKLPPEDGEVLFSAPHLRIVRQAQGKRYIYSNFCTSTVTASVLETVSESGAVCRQIVIPRERYPWGTAAEHLFELYDFPHYLPRFGKMLLHGAYVLYKGKAIVFTAPSGTGKSTQAELWKASFGAQIVNGDRVAIGAENGVAMAYGLPFSGSSDDCGNIDAPIAAIVSLTQAKENSVRQLRGAQAIKALMRGAYVLPQYREDMTKQLAVAQDVLRYAPICHLACLPDASAAQVLHSVLKL